MIDTKLLLGDCVEQMKAMSDDCIDLTVTSPPYDNLRDYHGYSFDYKATLEQLYRITMPGGVVVWIVADQTINGSETGTSFREALCAMECGFNLHDTMMWVKDGGGEMGGANRYLPNFEYMFVFSKGIPKTANMLKDKPCLNYNPNARVGYKFDRRNADGQVKFRKRKKNNEPFCKRNNWWYVPTENRPVGHPAAYPVELVRDHILTWSNAGETVLDPFMGSGTTGVACCDTDRNFIGIEISDEYFDVARQRIDIKNAQVTLSDIMTDVEPYKDGDTNEQTTVYPALRHEDGCRKRGRGDDGLWRDNRQPVG